MVRGKGHRERACNDHSQRAALHVRRIRTRAPPKRFQARGGGPCARGSRRLLAFITSPISCARLLERIRANPSDPHVVRPHHAESHHGLARSESHSFRVLAGGSDMDVPGSTRTKPLRSVTMPTTANEDVRPDAAPRGNRSVVTMRAEPSDPMLTSSLRIFFVAYAVWAHMRMDVECGRSHHRVRRARGRKDGLPSLCPR